MHAPRALTSPLAWLALAILALPAPALAAGGSVSGKVDVTPAKYQAETVVYLEEVPGQFPAQTANVDQKGMKFIPHVLVVKVGDTVNFLNHDTVDHNVYSPDLDAFNLGSFPPNQTRSHAFAKKTGAYTLLCSIHPEMLGFIYVNKNPFAAAVDETGHFTIKDVPPGTYKISLWNSHAKAPTQSVTVTAGKAAEVNFSAKK
jgi:plastocyanin